MNNRITPRIVSFALAAFVTWTVISGIDTLALTERSAGLQMSRAAAATQVAAVNAQAPRS